VTGRTLHVVLTERDLDHYVLARCRKLNLRHHHDWDSRGASERGFPDWVIFGPGGLLWREHKSAGGTLSTEQRSAGYMLQALGLDWEVWRPADVVSGLVEAELELIAAPRQPRRAT
jgi:hypothetical protein